MKYMETGFKVQIMLTDYTNIMWWSSIIDVFLFIFAFSAFMSSPKEAVPIFMHIFHVVRAILGFLIIWKVPKSSSIIDEIQKENQSKSQELVTLEQFPELVESALKTLFQQYDQPAIVYTTMSYFILTCIQFIFDLITFFVGCSFMKNDYDEYSYAGAMICCLSSVFLSLDLYYILWACSMLIKFENPTNHNLVQALIGFPQKLRKQFGIEPVKKESSSSSNAKGTDGKSTSSSKKDKDAKKGERVIGGALGGGPDAAPDKKSSS